MLETTFISDKEYERRFNIGCSFALAGMVILGVLFVKGCHSCVKAYQRHRQESSAKMIIVQEKSANAY